MITLDHISQRTKKVIFNLGWEVLPHTAYSPDMSPSDYYLFRALQHHLADSHRDIKKGQNSIDDFIESKPPSFYRDGIWKLPDKWRKVIVTDGDYFDD